MNKSTGVKISFGLLVAAAIILLFRYSFSFHLVTIPEIIHWVDLARLNPWLTLAFYVFFAVGVMFLPITLFPIMGGVLVDFQYALPLNLLASTIGAYASFLITRTLGRAVIEKTLKGRWKVFDHLAARQGFKSVLIIRLLGVPPFLVANYALGLSGVRGRDFLLATVVGTLPWMAIMTYASHSLWEAAVVGGEQGLKQALFKLILPFSIISLSILGATLAGFALKKKRKSKIQATTGLS